MENRREAFENYVMSFSYRERRSRALREYATRICELEQMESYELDFEFITLKAVYEHKKRALTVLIISLALTIIMNVWKYLFEFLGKALEYASSMKGMEVEIMQVSVVISIIIVMFLTTMIMFVLIMRMKELCKMQKELMIVEEVRKKRMGNDEGIRQ